MINVVFLIPVFDLFHLCLAPCHREPVENEEGPRIFLSTVLLEAPLSPLNQSGLLSLWCGDQSGLKPLSSARHWKGVSSFNV